MEIHLIIQQLLKDSLPEDIWAESDDKIEDANLFIKEIYVNGGKMIKRMRPAPQGRAHRIRKRSNHVTLILSSKTIN